MKTLKIDKVLLTQPNYSIFGKRSWKLYPYSLGILNACVKPYFKTEIYDPNYDGESEESIINYLKKSNPSVVGLSTCSTEYFTESEHMIQIIRKALPNAVIIVGE